MPQINLMDYMYATEIQMPVRTQWLYFYLHHQVQIQKHILVYMQMYAYTYGIDIYGVIFLVAIRMSLNVFTYLYVIINN